MDLPRKVKGRMFSVQADLPKLPVPPLQQTLDRYLKTIQPITTPEAFSNTEQIVKEFAENEGPQLQQLLEKRAEGKESWLSEWWLNAAYLDYRVPNVINSNPGMIMPSQRFNSDEEWLSHAAKIVRGALEYKRQIDNESLPVDQLAGKPLCMIQYYNIFSVCRVPDTKRDKLVVYPPNKPGAPRHITVLHNGHFFSLDMYGEDGRILNEKQITKLLMKVVAETSTPGSHVGVLTSSHRNTWANAHKQLKKQGNNSLILDNIEKSIFILCLDQNKSSSQDVGADDYSRVCRQMLYGDGSHNNTANRWFDKTLQFIVGRDGAIGLNYEHSPAEGPPIASLLDFVHFYTEKDHENAEAKGTVSPAPLQFKLNKSLEQAIESAKAEIDLLGSDIQLTGMTFSGFGKNFAKANKLSPDAVIQVAMQLAYFRDQGRPCATYESASTRMFQLGRTDTIRSCTNESLAFCKAMQDSKDKNELVTLFQNALKAHKDNTSMAVSGQGIDRHLLGLKLTAINQGMNVPALHMDPTYGKILHFNLSTSQVPCKSATVLCFGPVVPDGYGFCYNPRNEEILFATSAFKCSAETDSQNLANQLCNSLIDIQSLFPASSKL